MNIPNSLNRRIVQPASFTSFQSPSTMSHMSHSDYFTQSTYSSTKINDPKTQLLYRWQSLAQQILQANMSWDMVIALNRNLDQVEGMLLHRAPPDDFRSLSGWNRGLGILKTEDSGVDIGFMSEKTPSTSNAPEDVGSSHVKYTNSIDSAAILERVTNAVKQLRDRQQEFRHLHDMAALKTKGETERNAQLNLQINQLEQDVMDDETELTYLKLQLRIIEIQTLPYVPRNDHDDLALGIQRWKLDWADADKRYRRRRWKRALDKKLGLESSILGGNERSLTNNATEKH